jgi:hypothetical protein
MAAAKTVATPLLLNILLLRKLVLATVACGEGTFDL